MVMGGGISGGENRCMSDQANEGTCGGSGENHRSGLSNGGWW